MGRGTFGDVYLYRLKAGEPSSAYTSVAVKMVRLIGEENLRKAQAGITRIKGIDHQNLVRIYDQRYNRVTRDWEIVMEYCAGKHLVRLVSSLIVNLAQNRPSTSIYHRLDRERT